MAVVVTSALSAASQQIKMPNLVDTAVRTSHVAIVPVLRLGFCLSFSVLTAGLQTAVKLPTFYKAYLFISYINRKQWPIIISSLCGR
jgi:hypothetical protein